MLKRMIDHGRRVGLMCAVGFLALAGYAYFDKPDLLTPENILLAAAGIFGIGVFIVVYEEFVARHIYAKAQERQKDKKRA